MGEKFYYEILVSVARHPKQLIFWIRDEKIEYETEVELVKYVKNNLKILKELDKNNKILVKEVDRKYLNDLDSWYTKHSKKKDYMVIKN